MIDRIAISAILLAVSQIATADSVQIRTADVDCIQKALAFLESGDSNSACQAALPVANAGGEQGARAWLVIAAARHKMGELDAALEAYETCRKSASSRAIRDYAYSKISILRGDIQNLKAQKNEFLSKETLERLAKVDEQLYFASSSSILVQARNQELANLIATRAQYQLDKIWRHMFGSDSKFPRQLRIFVHANSTEYASAAPASPDWSCATARIETVEGKSYPRIDLTQLDDNGRLDPRLFDRILPHELCHIAVTEFFGQNACPLFLSEGLAMLAERGSDPQRHILAGKFLRVDPSYGISELFSPESTLKKPELFYALSYSLVEFLHSRMSRTQFQAFLGQVRSGCPFSHSIQRAMGISYTDSFAMTLSETWKKYSIEQSDLLQAVQQAVQSSDKLGGPGEIKP